MSLEWLIKMRDGKEINVKITQDGLSIYESNDLFITPKDYIWIGYYIYIKMININYNLNVPENKMREITNYAFLHTLASFSEDSDLEVPDLEHMTLKEFNEHMKEIES